MLVWTNILADLYVTLCKRVIPPSSDLGLVEDP